MFPDQASSVPPCRSLLAGLANNILNLCRSLQAHAFPTLPPAAEANPRDHEHENARRVKVGLPSLEEEELEKPRLRPRNEERVSAAAAISQEEKEVASVLQPRNTDTPFLQGYYREVINRTRLRTDTLLKGVHKPWRKMI